ncbi:MAG: hypothetical protein R3281_01110 [Balneolaceae bacterium]|nr:hypothetical protein [Balneolaceae bacterium]
MTGSLQDDEVIIPTTGYEKQSIRANMDHRFSQKFDVSVSSNYVHSEAFRGLTNNDNSGTTFGVAMTATPPTLSTCVPMPTAPIRTIPLTPRIRCRREISFPTGKP